MMYKIKRFSWEGRVSGAGIGTVVGASLANKLSRGSGKAQLIGAGLGLAGGYYLGHKLDKHIDKTAAQRKKREELAREQKVAEARKYQYPTKDLEKEYPAIVELGGMPKEYYQMVEICKKVDALDSYPSWGDGDEYQTPSTVTLSDVEDVIIGEDEYYSDINKFPLIWIGSQGYGLLTYDFNKHQWFDASYRTPKRVTNLKSHIIKIYEDDMKNYGYDDKGAFLDEDYIQEVIEYYTDIIKIIKYSKLG